MLDVKVPFLLNLGVYVIIPPSIQWIFLDEPQDIMIISFHCDIVGTQQDASALNSLSIIQCICMNSLNTIFINNYDSDENTEKLIPTSSKKSCIVWKLDRSNVQFFGKVMKTVSPLHYLYRNHHGIVSMWQTNVS